MLNYKQLVNQLKNGSTEAAYALFLATFKQTYYTALKQTKNDERTKYVVRDAYINAIKNISSLSYPEQFPVWVQSLSNVSADAYLRERKVYNALKKDGVSDGPWDQKECDEFNVSTYFANEIWTDIVRGINGEKIQSAVIGEAKAAEGPYRIVTDDEMDVEKVDNVLVKLSLFKSEINKRRIVICTAIVLVLAAAAGMISYGFNQKRNNHRMSVLTDIYSSPAEEKASKIAQALSNELAGEVGEIYAMSDNTYYVVIYLNNKAAGGAVVSFVETNEGESLRVISESDQAITDEQLEALADDQYLTLNYASDGASEENALESAINKAAETEKDAKDNQISLDRNDLQQAAEAGQNEKEKISEIFNIEEDINVMLTVRCHHVDLTQPVNITIDESVKEMIGNAGYLQIVLNDNRHCLRFSSDQIRELCSRYGSISVKLQAENNRIYDIDFWGPNGKETEMLFGDVLVTLPADSELSYVYANYNGGQTYAQGAENRGGSYDPVEKTVSFPVSHSGRYEIMGNKTTLFDVDALNEETKQACEFAAAMGFIPAGKDGNFNPNLYLTRGEFVEALGKMFLTTDKTQQVGFRDINRDDELYDFIAAGFAGEIINGRADGSFGAELLITVEELLSMSGKTMSLKAADDERLAELNNPVNSFTSVLAFSDSAEISAYAVKPIGTLVALDIIPAEGKLGPRNPASRSYAALVLKKMYDCVFEK